MWGHTTHIQTNIDPLFPLGSDDDNVGEVDDLDDDNHGHDDLDHGFYHHNLNPDPNHNPNDDLDRAVDHDLNHDFHLADDDDDDDDQRLAQYQRVLMPNGDDHGDNAAENDQDLGFPDLTL